MAGKGGADAVLTPYSLTQVMDGVPDLSHSSFWDKALQTL